MLPKNRPESSKSILVRALTVLVGVLFIATVALGFYRLGGGFREGTDDIKEAKDVMVPTDATVAAECEAGRGRQYIRPKDIPMGPIYDMHNGKVVAIEYLVNPDELSSKSDMFKNLGLPTGSYDHLSVMPVAAHAGVNENHFHVVAYLIPQTEADKITCDGQSADMHM